MKFFWCILFGGLIFVSTSVYGQTYKSYLTPVPARSYLLSQYSEDSDTFDPFVDYSEFEESTEEEADINFFRNGRFFTIGFVGGQRVLTEGQREIYQDAPTYGFYLSYFFDLRFALVLSFTTGSHPINFSTEQDTNVTGNASITNIGLNLKYYMNTQNVTRGLAKFNPYLVGGFSQVTRTATVDGQETFAKEGAMGVDLGVGIEFPLLRNKMYFGGQLAYQLVHFRDEESEIVLDGNEQTGIYPNGDIVTVMMILGVNF